MSKRDLQRIEVLTEALAGPAHDRVSSGSDLSARQTQRLLTKYRDDGGAALIHGAPGQATV
jgi:hypothetical protein